MIAIIGAMSMEVDGIVSLLQNKKEHSLGKLNYTSGELYGKKVLVARCGEGKVNSSVVATMLIQNHSDIQLVVNSGVAGGIMPNIKQGDIVVASQSVQHDYDLTPVGLEKGFVSGVDKMYFDSDKKAVSTMSRAIKSLNYTTYEGVVASGDQFVSDKQTALKLYDVYKALAVDMETASIAHACYIQNVSFVGIRAMSDNADGSGADDFSVFAPTASKKSIEVMCEFVKLITL